MFVLPSSPLSPFSPTSPVAPVDPVSPFDPFKRVNNHLAYYACNKYKMSARDLFDIYAQGLQA